MKGFNSHLLLAMGVLLAGCEKVIHVDLDTTSPKLVIDASIDWVKNTPGKEQKIKLSTTTGYYDTTFPTVSGATIFIVNSRNTVFNFPETANAGEYLCTNFAPVIGESYSLTIILNGVTYRATETLTGTPPIEDSIKQNNAGGMAGDEKEIQFSYQDNGSEENYYMTGITTSHVAFPEYSLEDDEMFQGKKMVRFYSHKDLKAGDPVNIKLYGVSKRFFDYFTKLLVASGSEGSPFATTPTAVRGNIINETDAKNYALGYFRLSEVVIRDYIIK